MIFMLSIPKYLFLIFVSIHTSIVFGQSEFIEETVVISAKYPVPLSEVIGSVDSISLKDIEDRQVSDLNDLLNNTVGVSSTRSISSGRTYNNSISIRGMGGRRVNLLVDGIRSGELYQGYGKDLVDTELLKRVEILKGPSSALYGSDGLAGAILYITKDPSDFANQADPYQAINFGYDSDNQHQKLSYLAATVGERSEALIQLTSRTLEETELHGDSALDPNPFTADQNSIFIKGKYLVSDRVGLTIVYDSQESEADWDLQSTLGSSGYPQIINTSSSKGDDESSRDRVSMTLDFSSDIGLFDNGSISIYAQDTDQAQITNISKAITGNFVNGAFGPQFVPQIPPTPIAEFKNYIFDQSIEGFNFQFFKSVISNSGITQNIVYGYEQETIDVTRPRYRTETNLLTQSVNTNIGGETYPNKTFPDTETKRTAFYINNRIDLSDKTSVVIGARNDSYELTTEPDQLFINVNPFGYSLVDQDESKTSLKLGFIRDINEELSFYYQYAEGFRSPDFYSSNLSFTNFAFRYTIIPNPDLGPEESEGSEFGFKGQASNGSWSVAFYDNDYKDFIETEMTGFTRTGLMKFVYKNLDDVNIKGSEIKANFNLSDNLTAQFGFNNSKGRQDSRRLTTVDPDQAILGLLWNSDDSKLSINTYARITDGSPKSLPPVCGRTPPCADALTLPDHTLIDSFISYSINEKFSMRLAIRNITDKKYWNWSDVAGSAANDSALDYFLNPGRNYSLSFRFVF